MPTWSKIKIGLLVGLLPALALPLFGQVQNQNNFGGTGTGLPAGCTGTAGTITCTILATSGANGGITGTEGTGAALSPAGGIDLLYPDSTNHCWHENLNGVDFGCTQTVVNVAGSGFIVPNIIGGYTQGVSTLVEATNEMECMRFIAPANLSAATHFTYMPTTSAGAATHTGFAIYNSAGSTRVATTGALDGTLTGQQILTITSFSLVQGTSYLFCWTSDAGTPATWATGAYTTVGSVYANLFNANTKNLVKGANASAAGVPPATLGALTAITAVNIPVAFIEP